MCDKKNAKDKESKKIILYNLEFKYSLSLIQNDTFFNFDAEYLSRPQKT